MRELTDIVSDREMLVNLIQSTGTQIFRGDKCCCPFPDHHDKKPSAQIRLENGVWRVVCWSKCGGKRASYFDLKAELECKEVSDVIREECGTEPEPFSLDQIRNWRGTIRRHEYIDLSGNIEFIKVKHPKGWAQFLRRGSEFFYPNAIGGQAPIYNKKIVKDNDTLVYVEGEKDVDTMTEYGVPATTGGLGAKNFDKCDLYPLKGKTIYIWMDADETGIEASKKVTRHLTNMGCVVYCVDPLEHGLETVNPKCDVSDYVEYLKKDGMSFEEIRKEIREVISSAKPKLTSYQKYRDEMNSGVYNSFETGIPLFNKIGFLRPRNISTAVGRGGIGKTWLVTHLHSALLTMEVKSKCLILEDNENMIIDRVIAYESKCRDFTDPDWCYLNRKHSEKIYREYSWVENQRRGYLDTKTSVGSDWESVKKWMNQCYEDRVQVVMIDPITQITGFDGNQSKLSMALMEFCKEITEREFPMCVMLCTHPKQEYKANKDTPSTSAIAQGNIINQASKSIVWCERTPKTQYLDDSTGYNAFFSVLKSSRVKAGISPDSKWAFSFTKNAEFYDHEMEVE